MQSLFSSFDLVPMEFKVQSNGGEHHTGFIYSFLLPAENAALSYSIKKNKKYSYNQGSPGNVS